VSESLGAPDWLTASRTAAVFDALEAAGGPGCARFVGGCVRNAILGRAVDDLDIATPLTPEAVIAALKAAKLKAVPTGVEHGTVTAVSGGRPYEITTLRRDVETDGRRAVVAYTTDWAEDAARRDFTLNAVYADRDGTLLDPTGAGVVDGRAGRVVFVGDPATRIAEDHLRILRFFRFYAWYGRGAADPAALEACAAQSQTLAALPAERVAKELLKLLAAADPRPAVAQMAEAGVLGMILPWGRDLGQFEALVAIETEQLFTCDPVLRLATLIPDHTEGVAAAAEQLRLSNAQRDRLAGAMGQAPSITSWMSPRETRRALYRLGAQTFADRVMLAWAKAGGAAAHQWRGLLALGQGWSPPAFPLGGEDVVAAGAPKGPMVGAVLREVEAWWIDQDFPDDRLAAVEKLKAVVQGMAS